MKAPRFLNQACSGQIFRERRSLDGPRAARVEKQGIRK